VILPIPPVPFYTQFLDNIAWTIGDPYRHPADNGLEAHTQYEAGFPLVREKTLVYYQDSAHDSTVKLWE